jgi:hypothetical protein
MAQQQTPGLWRTDLQRHDLSIPGREVVQSRVDIGPEAPLVKHTHPGEEIIYSLEGSLGYQIEGQPPKTLTACDTLTIRNVGSGNAAELATYVVEKKAAPHAGRVSASPSSPAARRRQPIQKGGD